MSEQRGTKNIVGNRIREQREASGMSQKSIVELLNSIGHSMTASTISKIETGHRGVSDMELKSFSLIFNCSINDLFV